MKLTPAYVRGLRDSLELNKEQRRDYIIENNRKGTCLGASVMISGPLAIEAITVGVICDLIPALILGSLAAVGCAYSIANWRYIIANNEITKTGKFRKGNNLKMRLEGAL